LTVERLKVICPVKQHPIAAILLAPWWRYLEYVTRLFVARKKEANYKCVFAVATVDVLIYTKLWH